MGIIDIRFFPGKSPSTIMNYISPEALNNKNVVAMYQNSHF